MTLRRSEWVLVAYFAYVAGLGIVRTGAVGAVGAVLIVVLIVAVDRAATARQDGAWAIVRDWLPIVLVLAAYWSVDLVALPHGDYELENSIVRWDRRLLDDWGMRAAIESLGPVLPALLELAYLSLYAVPPLAIARFYVRGERDRVDAFLFPFLLGTLGVYAVLPHFPSLSPRLLFAGIDTPPIATALRDANVWILDRWDIQSSVLPSGHVAAGVSAALAMRLAAPERKALAWGLLALTLLVWVDSVYSRYHYAVDGLAAAAISAAAIGTAAIGLSRARRTSP